MELSIGQTIRNLRKQKNLTQNQLAEAVGVSVAAVSKWESGKTYPDITLLPSLARQLGTTIDNLLNFAASPGPEELDKIIQHCSSVFDRESFEKGYALCREYLNRYPNDVAFKLYMGTIISRYFKTLPENKSGVYLEELLKLCHPAASGNDPELRSLGLRMLAGLYLIGDRMDLAEEKIHEYLTGVDGDIDPTLAAVLLKKGELEKAEEMYQRCLFRSLTDCQTALIGLSAIAGKNNSESKLVKYLNSVPQLSGLFGLEKIPGLELNAYLSLIHHYATNKQSEKLLEALEGFVKSAINWENAGDLSDNDYFWRLKIPGNPLSFKNALNRAFTRLVEDLRGYEFLKENRRFEELIGRLSTLVSSINFQSYPEGNSQEINPNS